MYADIDDEGIDLEEVAIEHSPKRLNDDELYNIHECTLQMYRQNKICSKNAFNLKLLEYLPAILERKGKISNIDNDDDIITAFQSVGTTLDASAKIYAARIDSLHYETIKAQTLLKSNDLQHQEDIRTSEKRSNFDSDNYDEDLDNEDGECIRQKTKKSRILARKKTIVNDRRKLLRKQASVDMMPVMNTFFLSAMNNDNILLSELYEKLHSSTHKKATSTTNISNNKEVTDEILNMDLTPISQSVTTASCIDDNNYGRISPITLSEKLHIVTGMDELNFELDIGVRTPLLVDTQLSSELATQATMTANDSIITPLLVETCPEENTSLSIDFSPNGSLSYPSPACSSTPPPSTPSIVSHDRFRSASVSSSCILTNISQLLSDKPSEYSYFDKIRLDEFASKSPSVTSDWTATLNSDDNSNHHTDRPQTPKAGILKRKLSIEFPFLNQKKKMIRKTKQQSTLINRRLSVELDFPCGSDNDQLDISTASSLVITDINEKSQSSMSSALLSPNSFTKMTTTDCVQTSLLQDSSLILHDNISCTPMLNYDNDSISPQHTQSATSVTAKATTAAGEKFDFLVPMIPVQKKQSIDVRNLQKLMHRIITNKINDRSSDNNASTFSEVYENLTTQLPSSTTTTTINSVVPSSRSIGIYFSALLNNAVLNKWNLTSNKQCDDIEISPQKSNTPTYR